jgi:hypothetical protein
MSDSMPGDGAAQHVRDMILDDEIGELPGAVFSGEGDGHH